MLSPEADALEVFMKWGLVFVYTELLLAPVLSWDSGWRDLDSLQGEGSSLRDPSRKGDTSGLPLEAGAPGHLCLAHSYTVNCGRIRRELGATFPYTRRP